MRRYKTTVSTTLHGKSLLKFILIFVLNISQYWHPQALIHWNFIFYPIFDTSAIKLTYGL